KINFPKILEIRGKKPWEVQHLIDTMDLWKFGDRKSYTSLDLLAHVFHIPSPKVDIDGSLVGRVYWEEKDLDRIRAYCEKDVQTTAQVWAALNHLSVAEHFNMDK
ncbi:MAG: 3'-5' exonuclease, partial [Saprospiraceae bacterium]|nr:3'-5' exonuclease [Saprospiraceae bacterium]